ncbi:MAG: hypothetical protein QM533_08345 [Cytophagales bacterium]|nr:hypothetical protein [Cytophagales bacterium]
MNAPISPTTPLKGYTDWGCWASLKCGLVLRGSGHAIRRNELE